MRKFYRVFSILITPIFILSCWVLYKQVMVWLIPEPKWEVQSNPQDIYFISWSDTDNYAERVNIQPVQDPGGFILPRLFANQIMDAVINSEFGLFYPLISLSPIIARVEYPNGEIKLTHYRVDIVDQTVDSCGPCLATLITYLDARTGRPLMLISDILIQDVMDLRISDLGYDYFLRYWLNPKQRPDPFDTLFPQTVVLIAITTIILFIITYKKSKEAVLLDDDQEK